MIKRVVGGYQVFSSSGRKLSKAGLTLAQAKERLAQVEHHKALNAAVKPKEAKK
jgi:hypothetical protein